MRRCSCAVILLFFYNVSIAQDEVDTTFNIDSTEVYVESLDDQIIDDEDSQLLDVFETEKPVIADIDFWKTSIEIRSRFTRKLQTAKGYESGKYLGSPLKSYQRVKLNQGKHITAGILIEKDAGERRLNDFINGFISYKFNGTKSGVTLGDYVVEAGQGLVLWRGYDFSKGADITTGTIRKSRELRSQLSSDENGFLRGAAVNLQLSNLSTLLFYSQKYLGASIDSVGEIKSIYTTSYYRTETEISKKSNLKETLLGARGVYEFGEEKILGITYYQTFFSDKLRFEGSGKFIGKRYSVLGMDYLLRFKELKLYGEVAANDNNNISGISGILISPFKTVHIVSLYRNYSPNYFSRYSNPFGEKFGGSNEEGFYIGIDLRPMKPIIITSYFDQFVFPKSSSINYPSRGNEYFVQLTYRLNPQFNLTVRYREKRTDVSENILDTFRRDIQIIDERRRQSYRLNSDYYFSSKMKIRFRFEYLTVKNLLTNNEEVGRLVYQDYNFKPTERLSVNCRINYFKTDSYNSGIGQYENDIPGVLTIPYFYGEGIKWYLLINYKILRTLELSVKYSTLIREDVKRIGTGLDELPSNYDNRIGLQVELKL
jgi:hypothetical protein